MHVVAVEAHRRHHQRTVAVKLAVDVAATVLAVPFALLIENVVQIRIGAQRGLLAQIALDVATARVGERGKGEHGHVAELRIATTVVQDGLRGGGIEHGDLRQNRSGLLSRRGLSFGDFLSAGSGAASVSGAVSVSAASAPLDVLGNLFFGGHSTLNLGLHRRDKTGRHTIELAHAGKRTLDILGARFGTQLPRDARRPWHGPRAWDWADPLGWTCGYGSCCRRLP